MKNSIQSKAEVNFKKNHPVGQSTHTGKWGWRRVNDCLNLKLCVYDTKRAAELDRSMAAKCSSAL